MTTDQATTTHSIEQLRNLLGEDWSNINQLIIDSLESTIPLINDILDYVTASHGKRLRPLLTLLSAKACGYEGSEHLDVATAIEFIHTATLLHDDVVDTSDQRHGHKATHLCWGNQTTILVGDFLYSRAFQLLSKSSNIPVMKALANTTNRLAEGEINQLSHQRQEVITHDTYITIIRAKTAELFAAGAHIGGLLIHHQEWANALYTFGLHFGLIYQIIDDLLDYTADPKKTGKTLGNDLHEGKTTLPLIVLRDQLSTTDQQHLTAILQKTDHRPDDLSWVQNQIAKHDIASQVMAHTHHHADKARMALETLPLSPYRDALDTLLRLILNRTY